MVRSRFQSLKAAHLNDLSARVFLVLIFGKVNKTAQSSLRLKLYLEISRGEAGEKVGKEGGTAFSFVTDAFKFLRRPSIGELDWLINNRMLSARWHCNL